MKSIYIVISQTGTWLSTLIKLYTGTVYHVSLSLENSLSDMYSFCRINPVNPFSGGFAEKASMMVCIKCFLIVDVLYTDCELQTNIEKYKNRRL